MADCRDRTLDVYVDNKKMARPFSYEECSGVTKEFSVITDLRNPTYTWTLDKILELGGLLLSEDPTCEYLFDNTTHRIYVQVKSVEDSCSIVKDIKVKGKTCVNICPNVCQYESVSIPSGSFVELVDSNNNVYTFVDQKIECSKTSYRNRNAVDSIISMIKNELHCESRVLSAKLIPSYFPNRCMTLEIINSPIKFSFIKIDNIYYPFNQSKC